MTYCESKYICLCSGVSNLKSRIFHSNTTSNTSRLDDGFDGTANTGCDADEDVNSYPGLSPPWPNGPIKPNELNGPGDGNAGEKP